MNRFFLLGLVLLVLQSVAHAQDGNGFFSIYLVRHAEKESEAKDPSNPALSQCGELRAESITRILSDIDLEKIYSTPYERTMATALPSAEALQLEVETYNPRKLEEFSSLLIDRRQNALVVGHSNTTGVLAGLLAGQGGEAFDEEEYDRLYQVVVSGGQGQINLFHQAFHCEQ